MEAKKTQTAQTIESSVLDSKREIPHPQEVLADREENRKEKEPEVLRVPVRTGETDFGFGNG
ncbi:MAG: hypothetical protein HYW65_04860 [Candidatus Liptonbacteria bacterium]|nr:hypothetical protein [Candidatus Liptonbacteria bacterium]